MKPPIADLLSDLFIGELEFYKITQLLYWLDRADDLDDRNLITNEILKRRKKCIDNREHPISSPFYYSD